MVKGSWIVGAGMVLVSLGAHAADKKLTRAQLPPRVLETIDRETRGATIKGFATEREHGVQVYEAETLFNGRTRDIQVALDGTLNEVEEEIAFNALPKSVQEGIHAKAKGADVVKVESLTKKGGVVAYEADTIKRGHKGSLQVGPSGAPLTHEE